MQFNPTARVAMMFALCLVLAALLRALWRRDRAEPALAWWAAGHAAGAAGMLLLGLRGVAPDRLTIDLANALVLLGLGLIWSGARRLAGAPVHPGIVVGGSLVWLLACQVPALHANSAARSAVFGWLTCSLLLASAAAFRRGMRQHPLPSHRAILLVVLGLAGLQFLRGLVVLVLPQRSSGMQLPDTAWGAVTTVPIIALMASLGVLMIALGLERAERRNAAVLTAARDAEAAARAAADAASAEKSRYLARMSHELRTPLNGVLGLAEALARDASLPPTQRDQALTLDRAGRHLLAIVNGVLDLALVESGRLVLDPVPIRLPAELAETLELIRPAAAAARVALRLELAPGLPEGVLADPVRLRQVLLNLLSNAVKFTPAGGQVSLAAAPAGPGLLRFVVTDTGPGVPAALRPHLFEEFAQGAQPEAGTGLGLAISAALAAAMGGGLAHAAGPGDRGSAFTATLALPAAEPPAVPPPPAPDPDAPRPLRLLVVDDAAVNRAVVRALLRPDGHVIEEAADGPAALAALRRPGPLPDAVLMDVHMPGMDGFQATAAIRALPGPAAQVPVIALTGDAMPEALAAGRAAGMDGHLLKPLRRAVLLAELARVVPA